MNDKLNLKPPRKITIVQSIIEQLVAQIIDGSIKPGDKLPSERQLIELLQVSRSSVREAVRGLAAMGLVEVRGGEGTFVKKPKPNFSLNVDIRMLSTALQKDMRVHINEARMTLETGIASLAAEKITKTSGVAIMEAMEIFEAKRKADPNNVDWVAHDNVHMRIAEATNNPFLVQVQKTLLDLVPVSLRDIGARHGSPDEIKQSIEKENNLHFQLCKAIVRGDKQDAYDWTLRHAESEAMIINIFYRDLKKSDQ